MESIWGYVLNATIYGSITGLAILIIKSFMKNKINKKYAYLLWMILIIKLIIPFGPESSLSIFNKIPVNINYNTNSLVKTSNKQLEISKYTVDNYTSSESTSDSSTTNITPSSNQGVNTDKLMSKIVSLIWITGAVLTLGAYIIIYLSYLRHINKTQDSTYLEEILVNCQRKLHIKRKINILLDDTISSPSLIGIFRIRILVPSSLIDLSENELKHIILHELCHYKNKDSIVNNILILLQCVHWFNPLVWFLFKRVRNDMEMACDERVLLVLKEEDHNKYGLTMLTVLEKITFNEKLIIGLNMADDKKIIKKRVELIKNSKYFASKKRIFTITGIACLLVLCGVLLTNEKTLAKTEGSNKSTPYILKSESEDLDKAISKVIIDKYSTDMFGFDFYGEFNVESHVILGKNEDDDSVEVYLIATYGTYEFENDIFNMISGSSNVPIKIKFSKVKKGEFLLAQEGYYYLDSEEASDGSYYESSVKKMFPKTEANKALNNDYTDMLQKDVHNQAVAYVKTLGRKSEVAYDYVEKEYIDEIVLKDMVIIEELYDYPQWIGTREALDVSGDNKRYIYETSYDKNSDIVTYTKYDENKVQIEMMQYKIDGDNFEKVKLK